MEPATVLMDSLFDALQKSPRARKTHRNSLSAHREGSPVLEGRKREIERNIAAHGSGTDREIMLRMGFCDMNSVRPRITELVKAKILKEVGNKIDPATGKTVRIVGIA